MTVVVRGDNNVLSQIIQQLHKLVDVIEVSDLTSSSFVERELVMVKVKSNGEGRREIVELANIFRAKVVDVGTDSVVVEATGSEGKIAAFIDSMRPFGIEELIRTGEIAITRSSK
jgi:acetolactate synthase-1/3 small subunit